ncbi:MAG TPA: MbcA/ParS/Xre antitoxin family protein [Flavobacteriales bacterium]|nr:MbcA/ParS/Xre antitoxin family protein [Flavobacteriales bacterium]
MMAKRKSSSPNMAAEPEVAYGQVLPKPPVWRFKRLSPQELMAEARKPMPIPLLRQRVEANPFAEPAYAELLHTTVSGLRSLLRTRGALVPAQAELVLLFDQAMARGVEVFGNEDKFGRWLDLQIPALGGRRPADLMTTFTGIRLVTDELETIAHGVFA